MTKQEIKTELHEGTYFFNQDDQWALDFWEEATEKCPELVEQQFKDLNKFMREDDYIDYDGDFELNDTYKEIFKDLNLK